MSEVLHVCVDIRGLLKNTQFPAGYRNLLIDNDGETLNPEAARDYLMDCLAKGWKVLPMGECPGFSYETGCPGHACDDDEAERGR